MLLRYLSKAKKSAPDVDVIAASQTESRCLVTLDLDFSSPLRFKPLAYSGIAVLRLPPRATANDLSDAIQTLMVGWNKMTLRASFELFNEDSFGSINKSKHA